jgi:hypothetical protein
MTAYGLRNTAIKTHALDNAKSFAALAKNIRKILA